jgi:hypothetical protein
LAESGIQEIQKFGKSRDSGGSGGGGSGDFGESRDFGNNAAIIYKNFYAKKYKKNNCGGAEGSIT